MKVTRRKLAGILAGSGIAARAAAQDRTGIGLTNSAPAASAASESAELKEARDRNRDNARQLSQVNLARSVEPATRFEA